MQQNLCRQAYVCGMNAVMNVDFVNAFDFEGIKRQSPGIICGNATDFTRTKKVKI